MKHITVLLLSFFILHPSSYVFAQGPLTPPGPPGPTMLTLNQVEPRTPITNLPYSITASGSYYVTTNLTGVSGSDGIHVSTSNVTIDLNGFSLIGVPGAFDGIDVQGAGRTNLVVRNGTIIGWPDNGIDGSVVTHCRFSGLLVQGNGNDGLLAGAASLVVDNILSGNMGSGIVMFSGASRIEANTMVNNGQGLEISVYALNKNLIIRNIAISNPPTGAIGSSNYIVAFEELLGPTNNLVDSNGIITNQSPWINLSF
jgi:hypothetical protein